MDTSSAHSEMNDTLRQRLGVSAAQLADFCRRWQITELAVFSSPLRDDFRPDSDVDLLVQFAPDATWSLFDHGRMERELENIAGREVDLLTRRAVEERRNWIRRKAILESAYPVHESG